MFCYICFLCQYVSFYKSRIRLWISYNSPFAYLYQIAAIVG